MLREKREKQLAEIREHQKMQRIRKISYKLDKFQIQSKSHPKNYLLT
jgi:hypothetical protein